MPTQTIRCGDCRDVLPTLPTGSVQTVVTSPPYFNLRDYGVPGQIGLEASLDEYLETLVAVFREVKRVLRADGTAWVNMGDSYANDGKWGGSTGGKHAKGLHDSDSIGRRRRCTALKEKDLMMVPARLALALQADGWYLRSDVIWHKPNPMPESVSDRPSSAHEHVFLFSKQPRYFYDTAAVRTDLKGPITKMPDGWDTGPGAHGSFHRNGREKGARAADKQRGHGRRHDGFNDRWDALSREEQMAGGANLRNVWTIATRPYKDAHFATFPPDLAETCIKAGTSEQGCCSNCGAPWVRQTTTTYENPGNRTTNGPRSVDNREQTAGFAQRLEARHETTGWQPGCACGGGPVPCVVLDPFAGAGTVALVADRLGRSSINIELNPAYCELARARIAVDSPLFAAVEVT